MPSRTAHVYLQLPSGHVPCKIREFVVGALYIEYRGLDPTITRAVYYNIIPLTSFSSQSKYSHSAAASRICVCLYTCMQVCM